MKFNLKNKWIPLLIIFLVAAGTAAGIFYYSSKINKELSATIPSVEISKPENASDKELEFLLPVAETSEPEDIDISGWKTYNNVNYGYYIKYPSDWKVNEAKPTKVWISSSRWRQDQPEGGASVTIEVSSQSLQQFIDDYNSADPETGSKIMSQEDFVFNGYPATRMIASTAIGIDFDYIFISYQNGNYIISYLSTDEIHNNMLSTFKFID